MATEVLSGTVRVSAKSTNPYRYVWIDCLTVHGGYVPFAGAFVGRDGVVTAVIERKDPAQVALIQCLGEEWLEELMRDEFKDWRVLLRWPKKEGQDDDQDISRDG